LIISFALLNEGLRAKDRRHFPFLFVASQFKKARERSFARSVFFLVNGFGRGNVFRLQPAINATRGATFLQFVLSVKSRYCYYLSFLLQMV
jgi:hypothetical protein